MKCVTIIRYKGYGDDERAIVEEKRLTDDEYEKLLGEILTYYWTLGDNVHEFDPCGCSVYGRGNEDYVVCDCYGTVMLKMYAHDC